jgi:trans-aconitate methyltransferase
MNNWQDIWASRTGPAETLQDLIGLDGFDTGAGKVNAVDWQRYVTQLADEIGIAVGAGPQAQRESVIELGCGAGAFLFALANSKKCLRLSGVDYSEPLLAVARRFLPEGTFELGDLRTFNFVDVYDHVVLHGVLHYLEEGEARRLVSNSLESAAKTVSVLEVPSEEKREEASTRRREEGGLESYDQKYTGLAHTFFDYDFFRSILKPGWVLRKSSMKIDNYSQADYRFGVIFEFQP